MALWVVAYFTPRATPASRATTQASAQPGSDPAAQDSAQGTVPGLRLAQPYHVPRGLFWTLPLDDSAPATYLDGQGLWTIAFRDVQASRALLQSVLGHGALDESTVVVPEPDTLGLVPGVRFHQPYRPSLANLPFTHVTPEGVEAGEGVGLWIVPYWSNRPSRAALVSVLHHLPLDESAPVQPDTTLRALLGARLRQPYHIPRLFYAQNRPALDDSIPPPLTGTDPYIPVLRRRRR